MIPRMDWLYSVAMGREHGYSIALVQGTNPDVDAGVAEDIIPWGGTYAWQTSAVSMEVVSTAAADASAGTGARTVLVSGLTAALADQSETVTLNGVTPVALAKTYYRVNSARVLTVGSGGSNAGDITVRVVAGAVPQTQIPVGYGRSQAAVYTVPVNSIAWLLDGFFSVADAGGTNSVAACQFMTRNVGGAWISRAWLTAGAGSPTSVLIPRAIGPVGAGGDVALRCPQTTANNTQVAATLSLLLQRSP